MTVEKRFDNGFASLYQGDARCLPIPDSSIDCVVTSPPYWGLRDYHLGGEGIGLESTPEEYCANMVEVFREVWRVLKPTGTLWLNLGDSYVASGSHSMSDTGLGGRRARTDNHMGRKASGILKPKDLVGIPWRVAFALQADGWYLRSDIIWSKKNSMPESVTDRPTKSHEYVFLLTKSPRYYYDADSVREASTDGVGGHNKRSVWTINTNPYPEAHFATFPEQLVEPCILAGCPQDGVVLDPFAGSGTTLAVAQRLGRKAIGVELSTEYTELAASRLGKIPLPLF